MMYQHRIALCIDGELRRCRAEERSPIAILENADGNTGGFHRGRLVLLTGSQIQQLPGKLRFLHSRVRPKVWGEEGGGAFEILGI